MAVSRSLSGVSGSDQFEKVIRTPIMELPGESRYVTVAGVRTHYIVAGDGEPLLLFHGLGASVATWRDNIGPLSKVFRVYGIDLPGHGNSDKPDMNYSADTLAQFALRLIDTLGLDRPSIIGNSVGGALGLMLALGHPERVSGLVLVDSASLGREISMYLRLVSVPGLGELLGISRVGGGQAHALRRLPRPELGHE